MQDGPPLVSIGIPTFDRADRLARSVASVLAQDHDRIEVLVADNGSTDGTAELVASLVERDGRVTSLRSEVNLGATANFNRVRAAATGDFFMWLGDDDWLDPGYVSACLEVLAREPSAVHVCGTVRYHLPDGSERDAPPLELGDRRGARRVWRYYRHVRDNGIFYGLSRMEALRQVPPMRNELGNDWNHVADLAFLGTCRVAPHVVVHRHTGGATASLKRAAQRAGMPWWQGEFPPLAEAWAALSATGWRSPVFAPLGPARRLLLGLALAGQILVRLVPQAVPKYARRSSQRFRRLLGRSGSGPEAAE